MTRSARRGGLCAAIVCATLATLPAAASASSVGLVDSLYFSHQVGSVQASQKWRALGRTKARIAVPFDIAQRPSSDPFRAKFESWLRNLPAGVEPYVTLAIDNPPAINGYAPGFADNYRSDLQTTPGSGHCYPYTNGDEHCYAPSLPVFTTAVNDFVRVYYTNAAALGLRPVKILGPWNEPDYKYAPSSSGGSGRRVYTPDNRNYLYDATCDYYPGTTTALGTVTADNCGPDLAARYWKAGKDAYTAAGCKVPTCLVVAGEFSGDTPQSDSTVPNYGYWGSYEWWLAHQVTGAPRPYIWATHPYGEAVAGDAHTTHKILHGGDPTVATDNTNYLGERSGFYTTNEFTDGSTPTSHLWDSAGGVPYGATQATTLGKWIDAVGSLNSSTGRVPRIYVYEYESCTGCMDWGLVSRGSTDTPDAVVPRPAYYTIQGKTP